MKQDFDSNQSVRDKYKNHMNNYLNYNYPGFETMKDQPYRLLSKYSLEYSLLPQNRDIRIDLKRELHNKQLLYTNDYNKLSMLDYILPYYFSDKDKLKKSLKIHFEIEDVEIKKKITNYFVSVKR